MTGNKETLEGGCTCRQVRYRMKGKPLFVHACHCTWCQRETGTVFATNQRMIDLSQWLGLTVEEPVAGQATVRAWLRLN